MNGLFTWSLASASTVNAAAIAGDATLLIDLGVGDTTTGNGVAPFAGYYSLALIDIGTTPTDTINGLLAQFVHAASATAYSSPDGFTWTNKGAVVSATLLSFTASSARFWLLSVASDGTGGTNGSAFISDLRWSQSSGGYVTSGTLSGPTPDFTITPMSQMTSITNGAAPTSLTPDLTINAVNGFSGMVNLAVTGQPSGLTATLSAATVAAGGTANLSLSAFGCAPGVYPLTVTGTSGSLTHSQTVTVTVAATASPAVPSHVTVVQSGLNLIISGT